MWVYVDTLYWCGRLELNADREITLAPPICHWAIGYPADRLKNWLTKKRYLRRWLEYGA